MTVMPRLEDLVDQSFDPFEMEKRATGNCPDPYPKIHELREQGPVVAGGYRALFTDVPDVRMDHLPQVMVLGYDAVLHELTHPEIFRNKEAFEPNLGKSFGQIAPGTKQELAVAISH